MLIDKETIQLEEHSLHRVILAPSIGTPIRKALIMSHGQGDFAERYINILGEFTDRGILCVLTDLPGHGRSSGKRGHAQNLRLYDKIVDLAREYTHPLPFGLAGHSMGGLLTLRHLTLSSRNQLPAPEFAWINAPLLRPRSNKPSWFITIAERLAHLFPSLTIDTGVRPHMCRTTTPEIKPSKANQSTTLSHHRISIGWGRELLQAADLVQHSFPKNSLHIPILMTQGRGDQVCSTATAQNFHQLHPWIEYHEFDGMLHEPFADVGAELLFKTLSKWLDKHQI